LDLRAFLLDVVSEVESLAREKGLALSVDLETPSSRIRSDPLHLRQILMNLLGNAIKYTHEGGVVVRSYAPAASSTDTRDGEASKWAVIEIKDTGIGIHAADHARIFEEFEQVGAGPRGDSALRGTGLGLAISRRLATALGGRIDLESTPGIGSTFFLRLPAEIELLAPKQSLELAHNPGLLDR
jgi:signal transduction histidine kinase